MNQRSLTALQNVRQGDSTLHPSKYIEIMSFEKKCCAALLGYDFCALEKRCAATLNFNVQDRCTTPVSDHPVLHSYGRTETIPRTTRPVKTYFDESVEFTKKKIAVVLPFDSCRAKQKVLKMMRVESTRLAIFRFRYHSRSRRL